MQVDAAVVKEQGVTFAVVVVHEAALRGADRDDLANQLSPAWGGVPVVLMAQNDRETSTYFGRPDLVQFLRNVPIEALPWSKWTIN